MHLQYHNPLCKEGSVANIRGIDKTNKLQKKNQKCTFKESEIDKLMIIKYSDCYDQIWEEFSAVNAKGV